jgi:hypothetical protein
MPKSFKRLKSADQGAKPFEGVPESDLLAFVHWRQRAHPAAGHSCQQDVNLAV